jgi:hypothetical protein
MEAPWSAAQKFHAGRLERGHRGQSSGDQAVAAKPGGAAVSTTIKRCVVCDHIIDGDDDFDKKLDNPDMCSSCNDAFKYTDAGD